ncbi:MAG: hypothetical protein ACHQFW_12075 [Chitinophagales bacterium]
MKASILFSNILILYSIIFQELNFSGVLFLFFIDLAVHPIFQLAKAERTPINLKAENQLKYSGELTYWDERKYRGKSEFIYMMSNIIILSFMMVYIIAVPAIIVSGEEVKSNHELIFPFQNNWFWACACANTLLYGGRTFYYLRSGLNKFTYFENILDFDLLRYWLFFVFVIFGAVFIGYIHSQLTYTIEIGIIAYAILYFILKLWIDMREVKRLPTGGDIVI